MLRSYHFKCKRHSFKPVRATSKTKALNILAKTHFWITSIKDNVVLSRVKAVRPIISL